MNLSLSEPTAHAFSTPAFCHSLCFQLTFIFADMVIVGKPFLGVEDL